MNSTKQSIISPYGCLVTAVLAVAMIGLNCDFDVVGGRVEEAKTDGGGLVEQAQFESGAGGAQIGRMIGLVALLSVGVLGFIGPAAQRRFQWNAVTILAAAALAWTVGSLVWSTNRHETSRELFRLLAFAFAAVGLVRRFNMTELIWVIAAVCSVAIIVDVAADVAAGTFQPWRREFRLGGTLHPNNIARLGLLVALVGYAAYRFGDYGRWTWLLIAGGTIVVLMSLSRSGLFAFAAGLLAIHVVGLSGRRVASYFGAATAVIAAALLIAGATPPHAIRDVQQALLMGRTEDTGSLTGRMPLWHEMWKDGSEHRWTGFGYGAYWTAEKNFELLRVLQWTPRHSHSIYMEVLIDLGFIGLGITIAMSLACIAGYFHVVQVTDRFEYRFFGALFVVAAVNGFFEIGFLHPRFEGLFMGMAVLALVLRQTETVLKEKPEPLELSRASLMLPSRQLLGDA